MRIAILLLAVPMMAACAAAETAVDPKTPDISVEKVSVSKVTPAGIDLVVELSAVNRNEMDLEAKSVLATLVLDNQYEVGTAEIPQEIDLPSNREVRASVPVPVDWKDIQVVTSLVALKRSVPYNLHGSVKVGVDLFKVEVPFDVNDVITEEQLRGAAGLPPIPAQ